MGKYQSIDHFVFFPDIIAIAYKKFRKNLIKNKNICKKTGKTWYIWNIVDWRRSLLPGWKLMQPNACLSPCSSHELGEALLMVLAKESRFYIIGGKGGVTVP